MKLFRCFVLLGWALFTTGRAAPDASDFEAAIKLYTQRKPLEAQQAFEQLAANDPENADIHFYLGRLALQREDPAKAVQHLEKAIALRPADSRFHQRLGDAYGLSALKAGFFSRMGFARKCLASYQQAVALDPTNIDARIGLIDYFRQAPAPLGGGMDKAYAQAAEIQKLDAARGRLVYAGLYVREKKYAEAFALYDEVLKASPDDYTALFQTGRIAALSGERVDRGIEALEKCLTLSPPSGQPGHAPAQWRLGQLHEKKGDRAAARTAYETAVKLDPAFAPAAESLKALP